METDEPEWESGWKKEREVNLSKVLVGFNTSTDLSVILVQKCSKTAFRMDTFGIAKGGVSNSRPGGQLWPPG